MRYSQYMMLSQYPVHKNIIDTRNKKINVIGDKKYIISSIFLHNNKKVNTIVPDRKNMKRSSKYNKTKLKKQYLIENVFAELKKFNCIKKSILKISCYLKNFVFGCAPECRLYT